MKIVDKTPYRSESGEIDIFGRLQGMLKYGMSWYDRVKAQDAVIAILEKQLGTSYVLLRNITLPNTEITLPMVLIGPTGVSMINVTHEHGIYRAKDEEWGTIAGERFVPAKINQVTRTLSLGRVLQVYLDRQGFKGRLVVDQILMAAEPGMHIESTRPVVRIVMNDALERFAISMAQGRAILDAQAVALIAKAVLVGLPPKSPAPEPTPELEPAAPAGIEAASPFGAPEMSDLQQQGTGNSFADTTTFSFDDDEPPANQLPAAEAEFSLSDMSAPAPEAARPAARKRGGGLNRNQLIILVGMALCWICAMAAFGIYLLYFSNV